MRRDDVMTVFNPRSPDGERHPWSQPPTDFGNISIHAPRMGSDIHVIRRTHDLLLISIHAPRMGSDTNTYQPQNVLVISIHAPRMGSDGSIRKRISGLC